MNVDGRPNVSGELLVAEAQRACLRACTVRLSNGYGSTSDHADRVNPAFARAAALGAKLRVDGLGHTFDFTRGIVALIGLLTAGSPPPAPIHFVRGRPTTLEVLTNLAAQLGQSSSCSIRPAASRDFDIARFLGDPSRAKNLLGSQGLVRLVDGLARLVLAFRDAHLAPEAQEFAR